MANYLTVKLDTTAPAGVGIELGGAFTAVQLITATMACTDSDKTGYQMKIWGAVDTAYDASVQTLEGSSAWISYVATKQIKLSAGDAAKTVFIKVRDRVLNESAQASDSISLDTAAPVVTIAGQTVTEVSEQATANTMQFSFTADGIFEEYKVKVVPTAGALHDAGVQIGTASGSVNMAGSAGGYAAATAINCTVKGTDIKTASAGDGDKIVKVFVRDSSGNWSV